MAGHRPFGPYGRAGLATLIALTLFALPPIITNSYVAMREVAARRAGGGAGDGHDRAAAVPAGRAAAGACRWWCRGVRLALVQVWATATIAALVAGPGLGRIITDGFFRSNYGKGIAGAVVVAAVALVLELLGGAGPARGRPRAAYGCATHPAGGHDDALSVTAATVESLPNPSAERSIRTRAALGRGTQKVTTMHLAASLAAVARRRRPALTGCAGDDLADDDASDSETVGRRRQGLGDHRRPELPRGHPRRRRCTSSSSRTPATRSRPSSSTPATPTCRPSPVDVDIVPEYVGGIVNFLNAQANGADAEPFEAGDGRAARRRRRRRCSRRPASAPRPVAGHRHQRLLRDPGVLRGRGRHHALRPRGPVGHPGRGARLRGPPRLRGRASPTSTASTSPRCSPLGYASDQTYQSVLDGESAARRDLHHRRHPGVPGPGAPRGRQADPAGAEPRARPCPPTSSPTTPTSTTSSTR